MDRAEVAASADSLRRLLALIDSGEIAATETERAHIVGALTALDTVFALNGRIV